MITRKTPAKTTAKTTTPQTVTKATTKATTKPTKATTKPTTKRATKKATPTDTVAQTSVTPPVEIIPEHKHDFIIALRAALKFAAVQDIRYYLNGVKCEKHRMIATDGHRLIVLDAKIPAWAVDKIIDIRTAKALSKNTFFLKHKIDICAEPLEQLQNRTGIHMTFIDDTLKQDDGTVRHLYPNPDVIMPKPDEKPISDYIEPLNLKYHTDAAKALLALRDPKIMSKPATEILFDRYGENGKKACFRDKGVFIAIMAMHHNIKKTGAYHV